MESAYIVAACRTPIGKFMGGLATLSAPQLAAIAIRESLQRAGVNADQVDEVILGNVVSAGVGQAPARQAALMAGLGASIGAVTINKVCGSGLKAIMLADQAIRAGDASMIVAGGMESMSRAPHLLLGSRSGQKFGHQTLKDSLLHDGLTCAIENTGMGNLSDYTAKKHEVSRADQDEFAARSHRQAIEATTKGLWGSEIVPVPVRTGKTEQYMNHDEGPRADSTPESLTRLLPAFDPTGTTTAGNSSQLSDGAAAVLVVDKRTADSVTAGIKARIVATATAGLEPRDLFVAPVLAIQKALAKSRLDLREIDLIELNEAFASQCLACLRQLDLGRERVNVHGGAIALGHPIGASGARIVVTLLHALAARGLRYGLASLCLGGGNAVAAVFERVE